MLSRQKIRALLDKWYNEWRPTDDDKFEEFLIKKAYEYGRMEWRPEKSRNV